MTRGLLVDSHCHLDFPDFADEEASIVQRALDAGVQHCLTICTHVTKFAQVRAVAQRYQHIFCTVGIHPHNVEDEPETSAQTLIEMTHDPKVIGIGETGLDFFYDHSPREQQETSFREHIAASRITGLPIVIHSRDAEDKTIEILRDEMGKGPFPGVMHCFSSHARLADAALDLGLYISFSGIVTFKKADDLRKVVTSTPLERILVETDAPYLAPVPKRGQRNEPSFVTHTAAKVAELKGMRLEDIASITTDNFFTLFSKAKAG